MQIRYETNINNFNMVPSYSFSYWCPKYDIFEFPKLSENYVSGGRNKTHNNDLYLRNWWEIYNRTKWQPYANGGDFRRWYGNNFDLINWSDEAKQSYDNHGGLYNKKFWDKEGICWNLITSYKNSFRIKKSDFHYSSASPTIFSKNNLQNLEVLGFLNTELTAYLLNMVNPTLNTTVSDVLNLPFKCDSPEKVRTIVLENLNITEMDWDSFETSWDFKKHPLI